MSNLDYKLLKFAEEVIKIPALRSYMLSSNDIDINKVEAIINKTICLEDNNAHKELVSLVMMIINIERTLED